MKTPASAKLPTTTRCVCGCVKRGDGFGHFITSARDDADIRTVVRTLRPDLSPTEQRVVESEIRERGAQAWISTRHVPPEHKRWSQSGQTLLLNEGRLYVSYDPVCVEPTRKGETLRAPAHYKKPLTPCAAASGGRARSGRTPHASEGARGALSELNGRRSKRASSGAARRVEWANDAVDDTNIRSKKSSTASSTASRSSSGVVKRLRYDADAVITNDELRSDVVEKTRIIADDEAQIAHLTEMVKVKAYMIDALLRENRLLQERALEASQLGECFREPLLSMARLKSDDALGDKCKELTGWPDRASFVALWKYVNGGEHNITDLATQYRSDRPLGEGVTRQSRRRKFTREDAFFYFWFVMKTGVDDSAAAPLFGISAATAHRSRLEMTHIMHEHICRECRPPTASEVYLNQDPKVEAVYGAKPYALLDATEIPVQVPSASSAHRAMYSSYKSHTTAKFLIAISADGLVAFCSDGYGGRCSDKAVVENSGILDAIASAGVDVQLPNGKRAPLHVLVDKGFDDCMMLACRKNIKLDAPTRKFNGQPFTDGDKIGDRAISAIRVHVERAMGSLKRWKAMRGGTTIQHLSLLHMEVRIVTVCAVNYGLSLMHDHPDPS